ncbi:MAG: TIGR01620 family protein [Tardiphaga sp.]
MTDRTRRPATFRLDDPHVTVMDADDDIGRLARGAIRITPEPEPQLPIAIDDPLRPARKGFGWGKLFWSALGGLVLLGLGLGAKHLVDDLFAINDALGYLGLGLAALVSLSLIVIIAREALGLIRLATIEKLHAQALQVIASDDRNGSRAVVADLLKLAQSNPRLARARTALQAHAGEIIDGADLIRVAERELMSPLDIEARRLVSVAAQRVSVVTAISPRALVDMLFVFAAAIRLVRQLAKLYGGRPGTLGMIALMRHAISHLAITGGMAASDSMIQQVLGHGVAAKLSQRLGEGILNGLLTARLGLAAIDVTRPLPFTALPRPQLSDLARDLLRKKEETEV